MTDENAAREQFADADLTHQWVAEHRIPLVATPYLSWRYEVALVVPQADGREALWGQTWPTDEEAAVIGDYISYRRSYYRGTHQARMLERALDVDSGTNPQILLRREDSWCYRLDSWTTGYQLFPPPASAWASMRSPGECPVYPPGAAGLRLLLDRINESSARWDAWKQRAA